MIFHSNNKKVFRYHARDVAMYRAHLNCPIILGSATPSIDSYYLARQEKLTRIELNQRAGSAVMPKMHLIDLKVAKKQNGLSDILIAEIKKRLKKTEFLIFLNRHWLCTCFNLLKVVVGKPIVHIVIHTLLAS